MHYVVEKLKWIKISSFIKKSVSYVQKRNENEDKRMSSIQFTKTCEKRLNKPEQAWKEKKYCSSIANIFHTYIYMWQKFQPLQWEQRSEISGVERAILQLKSCRVYLLSLWHIFTSCKTCVHVFLLSSFLYLTTKPPMIFFLFYLPSWLYNVASLQEIQDRKSNDLKTKKKVKKSRGWERENFNGICYLTYFFLLCFSFESKSEHVFLVSSILIQSNHN